MRCVKKTKTLAQSHLHLIGHIMNMDFHWIEMT